ncbi:MAG: hypothetical protein VX528_07140, partial [Candidatus Latescibacterota bacterium]|nr:hypothetical protein [Candidatus Latescibacterota bacterium]
PQRRRVPTLPAQDPHEPKPMNLPLPASTILFICTGNYYRSRYAEILFTRLARAASLPHAAASRGIRIDLEQRYNKGPISKFAAARLAARADHEPGAEYISLIDRMPIPLTAADLDRATRAIAMLESEHRPMMAEAFPEWVDRIDYWSIIDAPPDEKHDPLAMIEREVEGLVADLRSGAVMR